MTQVVDVMASSPPASPPDPADGPGRVVVDAVSHRYSGRKGDVAAVDSIELAFEPGEFVSIVGPSGCGKTTLLRMIAGFVIPTQGAIVVDGDVVAGPGADRGMVFQQPTLFPWLSVRDNIELGPRLAGRSRTDRRRIADIYLDLVGLQEFADHPPYELSGGMQQRCAIARALANDPAIVLMDEPFGALDAITREHLQVELRQLWRRTGKTVVFVTHSVEEALVLGTRVVVMSDRPGRIVLDEPILLPEFDVDARHSPAFNEMRARVSAAIAPTERRRPR